MTTENTTTTTENTTTNNKKVLWASVPWALQDDVTGALEITGNVQDRYLNVILAKKLQEVETENLELKKKVVEQKVDTSTSDTPV